ncbi:MAG TPA: beta-ketoacyl-[acyl-carrier-protein] synthase family protein [Vicinamibacterales bacterium]|nr:beta-ketoacyl-[acyl-carrier-protein] synthase family protein [Vicinamibacterales bacterium]
MRRVVITGIGLQSSLGAGRERVWQNLVAGRCGIGQVTLFDSGGYRSRLAAELADYDPSRAFTPLQRRRWSRSDQIAVLAAGEALDDSGLDRPSLDRDRVGVMFGAGTSDLLRNEAYLKEVRCKGLARATPSKVVNFYSNTPVDVVGHRFGLSGPRHCVVAACSSSTIAIGFAADAIRAGKIDAALAGGADVLCRLTFSGFNALRLVDTQPCRPFDARRAGMTIGEGAAVLVLEDFELARARGAPIYAELAGHSAVCEAYHPTSPEPDGLAIAATIQAALADARVPASDVDHINAHGTGTLHNDRAEARGFYRVFGDRARSIPVNAVKSMIGHCLGAAGAVEAAVLALTVARGVIPPTVNHHETDPDCALDVVPNEARGQKVRCGLSTSLAFGGNDAALVMRRVE